RNFSLNKALARYVKMRWVAIFARIQLFCEMTTHYLLAILDWGLGHASRCVPLVRQWQVEGKRVTVASSGKALAFLRRELPSVPRLELPAYAIRYPTGNMVWNMAAQAPKIARVILRERRVLNKFLAKNKVDKIVSDGRFGCFSNAVSSVWLAHQLQIQHDNFWVRSLANAGYHRWIKRHFEEVWVPDFQGADSLAGQLAIPISGLTHQYIGPLSRYAGSSIAHDATTYDYLALLSGPEPQRSLLEQQLLQWLPTIGKRCLLVRGVPGSSTIVGNENGVATVDWLLGDELLQHVQRSKQLICRSGYSTLMDLYFWQKPALLIPTPGQTEQEYLSEYWAAQGWARTVPQ
ncbi:MAG: glycosyltransferase, partial [Bacteroidota bacterium]